MRSSISGSGGVAAENNQPPTSIWPPCLPAYLASLPARGRSWWRSDGLNQWRASIATRPHPASHQPPISPRISPVAPQTSSASGPGGPGRTRVRSGRREGSGPQSGAGGSARKLGMDLPEVLSPLSPPPTQCGEEELRDLYLSPPSGAACMPNPGYSHAPTRTGGGGLRGSLPVEKPCLQPRREHHGAVELQQHRSEGNLRAASQKWTNSNSTLYNNSLG